MQNKPNFPKTKMNLNHYMTKEYENKLKHRTPAKQTQSNPILSASGGFGLFVHFLFGICGFIS
jgi:hypothetical protein